MVVPVLMTSCQVSDQRKRGPVIPQTRTVPAAIPKPQLLPAQCVTPAATRSTMRSRVPVAAALFFSLRLISSPGLNRMQPLCRLLYTEPCCIHMTRGCRPRLP